MITAPTPCFYHVLLQGDAARHLTELIAPKSALDIEKAFLTSTDFSDDITAVNSLSCTLQGVQREMEALEIKEKYNPLYTSTDAESLDELLVLEPHADGVRFIGTIGNPYVFKTVHGTVNEHDVINAKVEYRPFDLPAYGDLLYEFKRTTFN